MAQVLIIDYSLGNLKSVFNALQFVGAEPVISADPGDLSTASHAILPGVGAFEDGMKYLESGGWTDAIHEYVATGKPFLGICLGMQLLATNSAENGLHLGLNVIPGNVLKLNATEKKLRIPHVGWNDVRLKQGGRLFGGMAENPNFYFVHSYAFKPEDPAVVAGKCNYGEEFACILEKDNVFATQFHPEKSQAAGLQLLKNFMAL